METHVISGQKNLSQTATQLIAPSIGASSTAQTVVPAKVAPQSIEPAELTAPKTTASENGAPAALGEDLISQAKELQDLLQQTTQKIGSKINFAVNIEEAGRNIAFVVLGDDGRVLRRFPPEEVGKLSNLLKDLQHENSASESILLDKEA